jgi:hypothetical protein
MVPANFKFLAATNSSGLSIYRRQDGELKLLPGEQIGFYDGVPFSEVTDSYIFQLQDGQKPRNFYHLGKYYLVPEVTKALFDEYLPRDDFDIAQVKVLHSAGYDLREQYYAIQILRTVDCVDLQNTRGTDFRDSKVVHDVSFAEKIRLNERDRKTAPNFMPMVQTASSVRFIEGSFPIDAVIFRPLNDPSYLARLDFLDQLENLCKGEGYGYCFWVLGLANPAKDMAQLQHDMR